jgi:hypothetical protein
MKITLGNTTFPSKRAADRHLLTIINKGNGYVVTEEEFSVLNDLLNRHPEAESKRGCGVSTFIVDRAPDHAWQSCFHVVRIDGSSTDFSRHACLKPDNSRTEVLRCLRDVVAEDIQAAKRRMFDERGGTIKCPITGLYLDWKQCHADHEQPMTFEVICSTFVEGHLGITFDEFRRRYIVHVDNSVPHIVDGLNHEFTTYHKRMARIRLIHGVRNCSQAHQFRLSRTQDGYLSICT